MLLLVAVLLVGGYAFYRVTRNLPQISSLQDYQPSIVTTVYADDSTPIAEYYLERRIVIPLAQVPQTVIDAFVAAEDSRFFEHEGIDFFGIVRALWKNIKAGGIVQGGSTITQQVTKSLLLTPERSFTRKLREAILAYRIEKHLSKEEILFLYLNQIYLGHGAYGVEAAAQNYFGKNRTTSARTWRNSTLPNVPCWLAFHRRPAVTHPTATRNGPKSGKFMF